MHTERPSMHVACDMDIINCIVYIHIHFPNILYIFIHTYIVIFIISNVPHIDIHKSYIIKINKITIQNHK